MGLKLVVAPIISLSDDRLPRLRRDIEKVCTIPEPNRAGGVVIDPALLSTDDRTHFDDGKRPDAWLQWWLSQIQHIQTLGGAALITLEPGLLGHRLVEPLQDPDLSQLSESPIWDRAGGVIVAWGISEDTMNRRHLKRIPCAGALGVHIDGCAAILVCKDEVYESWQW